MAEEQTKPSGVPEPAFITDQPATDASTENAPAVTAPIVVRLGAQRRRRIEQLSRAQGPLMTEVAEVVEEVRRQLGDELTGRTLVPLVMVYRQKRSRRGERTSTPARSSSKRRYRIVFPR
jgi:hypothetical protein